MTVHRPERDSEQLIRTVITVALDREVVRQPDTMTALDVLWNRLGAHLTRWIGGDGWRTLRSRVFVDLAQTEPRSTLELDETYTLRRTAAATDEDIRTDGVTLFETLTRTLGRYVGLKMALRLLEQGLASSDNRPLGGSNHG